MPNIFEIPTEWVYRPPYDPADNDETIQRASSGRDLACRDAASFIKQAVDESPSELGEKVDVRSPSSKITFPSVIKFFIFGLFNVRLDAESGGTQNDPEKISAIYFLVKIIYCILYPQEYKIIPIVESFLKYLKLEQSKQSAIRNNKNNLITKKKLKTRFTANLIPNLETEIHQTLQNRSNSIDICCIVDVMNNVRQIKWNDRVKTFKNLAEEFCRSVAQSCIHASRIDFIFDSYFDRSLKCAERLARYGTAEPAEFEISSNRLLPIDQQKQFWACSKNKVKLQSYLRGCILNDLKDYFHDNVELVLSATEKERCEMTKKQLQLVDPPQDESYCEGLQIHNIEEADERMILHISHAISKGYREIFIMSRDADLLVLALYYYWKTFKNIGLKELWIKKSGESEFFQPVHVFAKRHGLDRCRVLPALYNITMAVGTVNGGIKIDAVAAERFLSDFAHGKSIEDVERSVRLAKRCLEQSVETMDSDIIDQRILQAFLLTYNNIHILDDEYNSLDPLKFGYRVEMNGLMPI